MKFQNLSLSRSLAKSLLLLGLFASTLSAEQFGLFTYRVVGDNVWITDFPEDAVGAVEIPAEIDGKPVTSIGSSAFESCTGITSVTIPEGVTSIPGLAFAGCTSLTTVSIPGTVTSIVDFAFFGCSALTEITIPAGVTTIGRYAFSRCTGLTSATIPGSASIDYGTFLECTGITSVTISEGVTSIPELAFLGCTGLTSVTIPEGVTFIDKSAFSLCTSLASVTIPGSVISIGEGAFWACTSLNSVTIPEGVTTIWDNAFFECTSLTSVTIPAGVTFIGGGAFSTCTSLAAAIFLGDAPSLGPHFPPFIWVAPNFSVYYLSGSSGFSFPIWSPLPDDWGIYPAVMLDEAPDERETWLLGQALPLDTDLGQDLNGDGVSLLMAYALKLNPNQQLLGSLPVPAIDPNGQTLNLSFHGASAGITYTVETSTDLENWTTTGVTLSEPNLDGQISASVERDVPRRFLRLVIQED